MGPPQHHRVVGTVVSGGSAVSNVTVHGEKEEECTVEDLFQAVKTGIGYSKVEEVVKKAPKSWLESRDDGGHTLTHWVAKRGEEAVLELLLSKGAPVDEASNDQVGMRPLHWACTEGRLGCARLLARSGADLDARDLQGCTPLIIASQWGQADMAAFLIKMGAMPKLVDKHDDSALHWASYKGNLEIVGLLNHLGLPLDDADAYGQTPLHLAALCGNLNVCEYLLLDLREPVRLEPIDKNNKSPRDLAVDKGHKKLAYFLDSQKPLCQQSPWAFIKHKLTFKAYIYWLVGGSTPDGMRWPFMIMVFNKVLAHFFYFFYFLAFFYGVDAITTQQDSLVVHIAGKQDQTLISYETRRQLVPATLHAINLVTQVLAWISFLCAWRCDPGLLDQNSANGALRRAYDKYFDRLVTGKVAPHKRLGAPPPVRTTNLCHSCHIQRPLRAKHCRVRRKCVMAFDHYCPYVGNAVGLYNYRFFFAYCFFFTLSALQWQYVAVVYLYHSGLDYTLLAAMAWVALFILFGLAMVTYHIQLVYSNLTTNEHLNVHRYEYLHDPDNPLKFKNPYDKGLMHNLLDKFFPPALDQHPLIRQIAAYIDDDDDLQHHHTAITLSASAPSSSKKKKEDDLSLP